MDRPASIFSGARCTLHVLNTRMTREIGDRIENVAYGPILICCGMRLVWILIQDDDIWDAKCPWCGREFSYSEDPPLETPSCR